MNKLIYIMNFFNNLLDFIKILVKRKSLSWNKIENYIEECEISEGVKIYGNHRIVKATIEKGTYISYNSHISYTKIGKFCSIGANLVCGWGVHPLDGISTSPVFYSTSRQAGFTLSETNKIAERKLITIGNDVFIGANATILDGVSIGDGAVIGAGTVVSKDIPPYAIAVGCPIKIIKYRFSPEIIQKLLDIKWWNFEDLTIIEKEFFNVEKFVSEVKIEP